MSASRTGCVRTALGTVFWLRIDENTRAKLKSDRAFAPNFSAFYVGSLNFIGQKSFHTAYVQNSHTERINSMTAYDQLLPCRPLKMSQGVKRTKAIAKVLSSNCSDWFFGNIQAEVKNSRRG